MKMVEDKDLDWLEIPIKNKLEIMEWKYYLEKICEIDTKINRKLEIMDINIKNIESRF